MSGSPSNEGAYRRQRAQGRMHGQLQEALASLDGPMAEWADQFIFGEVWGRPGISEEERMLVAIVALASRGNLSQLRNYLHGAIQGGIDQVKLREALVMLTVYAGFPVAIDALLQLKDVIAIESRHTDQRVTDLK